MVAMVIPTPPPKWVGHYKEQWVYDTDAMAHITNNNRYMYNICPMKRTITVADGTVYLVQSEGEVLLPYIKQQQVKMSNSRYMTNQR
jgi:hypothetical protein